MLLCIFHVLSALMGVVGVERKTVKKHFGSCHLMMKSSDTTSSKKHFFSHFYASQPEDPLIHPDVFAEIKILISETSRDGDGFLLPSSRESDDALETIKRVNFSSHFIAELRLSANSGCHCDSDEAGRPVQQRSEREFIRAK